jgi:serine/threonine-protein kinase
MLKQQINNYKILSQLGEGGMASVYLAEHITLGLPVALKILAKEFAHNENIRKRFLAEARNMFKMSHPNIIKVTDLIEEGDTVAFVMEYIEGDTLKEYLERKGKLNNDEIKTIFKQMLEAVGYVHSQNLVHRDIKPSNFMLDKKGIVKLLDFGIAKNTDTSSAEYTQTGTGVQMGTLMYMSPEQVNETKSVTAQSDIYSLGVVLWQMVVGQKPYDTKTLSTFQLQSKIVNENLALTNTNWDASIQKATHKNIDSRYTSAQHFFNDLQNPTAAKVDKTAFEKNDDKTIFENKADKTIIENNETLDFEKKVGDYFKVKKDQPSSNKKPSSTEKQNGKSSRIIIAIISLIVLYPLLGFSAELVIIMLIEIVFLVMWKRKSAESTSVS